MNDSNSEDFSLIEKTNSVPEVIPGTSESSFNTSLLDDSISFIKPKKRACNRIESSSEDDDNGDEMSAEYGEKPHVVKPLLRVRSDLMYPSTSLKKASLVIISDSDESPGATCGGKADKRMSDKASKNLDNSWLSSKMDYPFGENVSCVNSTFIEKSSKTNGVKQSMAPPEEADETWSLSKILLDQTQIMPPPASSEGIENSDSSDKNCSNDVSDFSENDGHISNSNSDSEDGSVWICDDKKIDDPKMVDVDSQFILGQRNQSDNDSSDTPFVELDKETLQGPVNVRQGSDPSFRISTNQKTKISHVSQRRMDEIVNESKRLSHLREIYIAEFESLRTTHASSAGVEPDGGLSILQNIKKKEREISEVSERLAYFEKKLKTAKVVASEDHDNGIPIIELSDSPVKEVTNESEKIQMGKRAQERFHKRNLLTIEALKRLQTNELESRENEEFQVPREIKVPLKPHQLEALSWLVLREGKKYPSGGILADDMGLGKTLTMIALILYQRNQTSLNTDQSDSESNDESNPAISSRYSSHGTLVVCPTSVMGQWESEIKSKLSSNSLKCLIYHGKNRESKSSRIINYDVVVTSYAIIQREDKTNDFGPLLKVKWNRIILDEAHIIRNHKALTAKAVFLLNGKHRWCLTGTPIQNKRADLFSLFKFLKVQPFDDIAVFKGWVDCNHAAAVDRLNYIMKSITLRRTKDALQSLGLKEKELEIVKVQLTPKESELYEKVLLFSKSVFLSFMTFKAEKEKLQQLPFYNKQTKGIPQENPFKDHPEMSRLFSRLPQASEVGSIHILILLLRLRQLCIHPCLITEILTKEDFAAEGKVEGHETEEALVSELQNLSLIGDDDNGLETESIKPEDILCLSNPIFDKSMASSKIKAVINHLNEKIVPTDDKCLIISQFVSVLNLIEVKLKENKILYTSLTGETPIPKRIKILENFNSSSSSCKVMLLSLQAGGTGINLVGANHILFVDPHWNPQLERQAFDRIYRIGQSKNVFIHKFICDNTIEELILKVQELKLDTAESVLTGNKKKIGNKLTIEDLRILFGFSTGEKK